MATYSSKPVIVATPAGELFDKVSNLESFQQSIESLPQEHKDKLGDVRFTADSIIINAPVVGQMTFNVVERRRPDLLKLSAENSPVPFIINIKFKEADSAHTHVTTDLDVEIPMMLRPMVGGKMQEAADKFGEMFANFFGGQKA